ncbi:hypothetical protein NBRC10513_005418 [Rhodotorula toruloides]
MAPITLAANQEVAAAAPALVNEEHNPTVTSYMACTVSRKDVSVEMVDEEHNPTVTSCAPFCLHHADYSTTSFGHLVDQTRRGM